MSYLLKRTDQGGGYVAKPGSKKAYTYYILSARVFKTIESAEKARCVENEVIVDMDSLLFDSP